MKSSLKRSFALGFLICLAMVLGCAAFNYPFYGMDGVSFEEGKLLGPKPSDDLSFSVCAPTEAVKHPCIIIFAKDFFLMKQDYDDTKQKLQECQKK